MSSLDEHKAIWISWEIQRRNSELAKAFGNIPLFQFDVNAPRLKRYIVLAGKTLGLLKREDPDLVFVQNPSIVLVLLVLLCKVVFRYDVIVDLHTKYFKPGGFVGRIIHYLEGVILNKADLTIVSNSELLGEIKSAGGRGVVLPDKIPYMPHVPQKKLAGNKNVVFICTFSADEPVDEVIKAAALIAPDIYIYVTGRLKKASKNLVESASSNIIFTDFLNERDYIQLLWSADVIMDFTTINSCLVCGAYESVSVNKPLITSDTSALRNYFYKGVLFADNTAEKIAEKIQFALNNRDQLINDIKILKKEMERNWEEQKNNVLKTIELSLV